MKDFDFVSRFSEVQCAVDEDGFVSSIKLSEGKVSEEALANAAYLPRLRSVALRGDIDSGLLLLLQGSASLRRICISFARNADQIFSIVVAFPQLLEIEIFESDLRQLIWTDAVASKLDSLLLWDNRLVSSSLIDIGRNCSTLKRLWLSGMNGIDDECMPHISSLNRLAWLDLSQTSVTDNGIKSLERHPTLVRLDVEGCTRVTDRSLKSLTTVDTLIDLRIDGTGVSTNCISHLRQMRNIRKLCLTKDVLSPQSRKMLMDRFPRLDISEIEPEEIDENLAAADLAVVMKKIMDDTQTERERSQHLTMASSPSASQFVARNPSMHAVVGGTEIEALYISQDSTNIVSELDNAKSLTALSEVHFCDVDFDEPMAASLKLLPNLRKLTFERCRLSSSTLHSDIEELVITHCETDNRRLCRSLVSLKSLQTLVISDSTLRDSEIGNFLSQCKSLRTLNLAGNPIGDSSGNTIVQLPNLEKLTLEGTLVSDFGASCLSRMNSLVNLNLSDTSISDASVPYLVSLKNLRRLAMSKTKVSSKSSALLSSMTTLTRLLLPAEGFTEADQLALAQKIPSCRILFLYDRR